MTFDTMTHGGEFKPRLASMRGLENRFGAQLPLVEWDKKGKSGQITNLREKNGYIAFDVLPMEGIKENQSLTSIRINQFYLYGWRAQLNGVNIPFYLDAYKNTSDPRKNTVDSFAYVDYNGRIGIALPLNKPHTVRLWYDGPPHWGVRNGFIGAVFVFFIYLIFVRKPKSILPIS
jgi:hypothetical protein